MRRSLVAALGAACFVLTSCGGSGSSAAGGSTTPAPTSTSSVTTTPSATPTAAATASAQPPPGGPRSEAAAQQVVVEFFDHFFKGEGKEACRLLTRSYAASSLKEAVAIQKTNPPTDCAGAIKVALSYAKQFGLTPDSSTVTGATVKGDTASVFTTAKDPFEDTTYRLVWGGSSWLINKDVSSAP